MYKYFLFSHLAYSIYFKNIIILHQIAYSYIFQLLHCIHKEPYAILLSVDIHMPGPHKFINTICQKPYLRNLLYLCENQTFINSVWRLPSRKSELLKSNRLSGRVRKATLYIRVSAWRKRSAEKLFKHITVKGLLLISVCLNVLGARKYNCREWCEFDGKERGIYVVYAFAFLQIFLFHAN